MLKITERTKREMRFDELDVGEFFYWEDGYNIKLNNVDCFALDILDIFQMDGSDIIEPVDAEIVIS